MKIDFGGGWFYDFEELTVKQIYSAQTLFVLYEKQIEVLPVNTKQEQVLMLQTQLYNAYAYLIQKEGEPWDFDKSYEFVTNLKGSESVDKLEQVRTDFFGRMPFGSKLSTIWFESIMRTYKAIEPLFEKGLSIDTLKEFAKSTK